MKTDNIKQNIKINNIIANKSTKKRNPLWKENKKKEKSMCKIIFIKKILKGQKLIVKKKAKKKYKKISAITRKLFL